MKQETLEQRIEYISFIHKQNLNGRESEDELFEAGILAGIEETEERMYSEEEAGELVYNIIGQYGKHYDIMIDGAKLNELFEQFKKNNYA